MAWPTISLMFQPLTTRPPLSWGIPTSAPWGSSFSSWGSLGSTPTTAAPLSWGSLGSTPTSAPLAWGLGAAVTTNAPTAMEANFKKIGEDFAQFFYQTFDTNRPALNSLFDQVSLLTFDGEQFQGTQPIAQKLGSLQFQTVKHVVAKCDCHPVPGSPDKVIVFIIGTIVINGNEAAPVKFSEFFQLVKKPTGQWLILNDVFRINP